MKNTLATVVATLIAVAAFLWFVWPTPYRYTHTRDGSTVITQRENRFTGQYETLEGDSWVDLAKQAADYRDQQAVNTAIQKAQSTPNLPKTTLHTWDLIPSGKPQSAAAPGASKP